MEVVSRYDGRSVGSGSSGLMLSTASSSWAVPAGHLWLEAIGRHELANQMHDFGTLLVCAPITRTNITDLPFMHVLLRHRREIL